MQVTDGSLAKTNSAEFAELLEEIVSGAASEELDGGGTSDELDGCATSDELDSTEADELAGSALGLEPFTSDEDSGLSDCGPNVAIASELESEQLAQKSDAIVKQLKRQNLRIFRRSSFFFFQCIIYHQIRINSTFISNKSVDNMSLVVGQEEKTKNRLLFRQSAFKGFRRQVIGFRIRVTHFVHP